MRLIVATVEAVCELIDAIFNGFRANAVHLTIKPTVAKIAGEMSSPLQRNLKYKKTTDFIPVPDRQGLKGESGANPLRSRRCEWGRKPKHLTA